MQIKARKLLIKMAVWLITEIIFNLMGIDDLIDYSEFIFEQNLAYQEKQILVTEDSIMAISRKYKTGKREKFPEFPTRNALKNSDAYRGQSNKRQIFIQSAKASIAKVLPWVAFWGSYGLFISLLDRWEMLPRVFSSKAIAFSVVGFAIALGSLLTLRINTAYKSLHLGYKLWSTMVDLVNNQVRGIWLYVKEYEPQDQYEKESMMRLLSAFAVATKLHLRQQPMTELKPLLSQLEYKRLQVSKNAPLDIILWLGDCIERQYKQERIDGFEYSYLKRGVDRLTNILGDCERVAKKSVPSILTTALKVLSIACLIVLPVGIVNQVGLATALATSLFSFIYLSLAQIVTEIEQPFNQYSERYLDFICNTIKANVENLIQQTPRPQLLKIALDLPRKAA